MTDKLRAAAEAAIGAMVRAAITGHSDALDGYAEALRAALAEPEVEPVAWGIIASNTGRICRVELDAEEVGEYKPEHVVPLYAHPPRREWVGLTEEEQRLFSSWLDEKPDAEVFAAIEAALKEKNHV